MDTPREIIATLKDIHIEGLYFKNDDGEKTIPNRLFFGIDFPPNKCIGGECFYFTGYALYPVFKANGERYRIPDLENVCASYKDGVITRFYKE